MELPTINTKKTKIMRMSTVEGRTMKITVNGQNLERVKQFCYLGSLVTEDCRSCHDVRRRIALGKEAFSKKSDLMRGSLSLHLKKRMVKAFVWSVALYGSETYTLQKEDIRRLEAFEIWIWRHMMKVTWSEHTDPRTRHHHSFKFKHIQSHTHSLTHCCA